MRKLMKVKTIKFKKFKHTIQWFILILNCLLTCTLASGKRTMDERLGSFIEINFPNDFGKQSFDIEQTSFCQQTFEQAFVLLLNQQFYWMNDFAKQTILLNNRSVRKRTK